MKRRARARLSCLAAGAIGAIALASAPPMPGQSGAKRDGGGVDPRPTSAAPSTFVQPQPRKGSCHARGSGLFALPDPHCTQGTTDPAVAQRNIATTICREGRTASVRAPERVTEAEKRSSLAAYGDAAPVRRYEYDHLIPLELGGAVNDPRNLWPEPGASPNPKDHLEHVLNALVCRRRLPLRDAQRVIATNWVTAYRRYVSPGGRR